MSEKPPRRIARQTKTASTRLTQSQIVLMAAIETNQASLIDRVEELLRPLETKVDELTTLLHGALRQIDQLHERQELQERQLAELPLAEQETTA